MIHLGDITKIHGNQIPAVDCITGGSPCQDLSIAGKRAGLAGERSGLFMEQMRVAREMRERDRNNGRTGVYVRPRYMVWENVPGAFSSGQPKGADFAAVIEEIIKVCEPGAGVSVCIPKNGWPKSGCYYADDGIWSVAWRVHDAQFWGVPQRRKRIALVVDFGGLTAPEVLFERKGLSGDSDEGEQAWQEATRGIGTGADRAVTLRIRGGCEGGGKGPLIQNEKTGTLGANQDQTLFVVEKECVAGFKAGQGAQARGIGWQRETSPTLAAMNSGTNQTPAVFDARGNGNGKTCPTIVGDHQAHISDYTALCVGNGQVNNISMAEQANTLDAMHD